MKHSTLFLAVLVQLLTFISARAQTPVNGYARVTAIAGTVLTLTNVDETYDTFEDGEYVIVMQMQDNVLGNTSNTASFGDMTATALSAGLYEVAMITTHTEVSLLPNTVTLTMPLSNTYNTGANSRVQLISYPVLGSPNYTSPAAGISAVAWNGNTGGVIAMWVNGTLTLGGNITANAVGFRGGAKNTPNGYTACEGATYATGIATRYAAKGESIYLRTNAAYAAGRGKMLNGGGGGNDVNAGGGGGGNYSAGGNGGIGWTPSGTGCSPGVGGLGGMSLQTYISGARLFMGGGGGGGHENDGVGSVGAAAGGSVLLQVTTYTITGTCPLTISANGGNGGSSVTSGAHGGGGGGGQGAVIFSGAQPTTNVTTQTNAGTGGSSCATCTASQNGVGGTGPNNQGILTGNSNPLPVELLVFTGRPNGNQVDLTWQTATEIDNDFFTVERRDEIGNMTEIGRVDGNGTTSQIHNYALTDFAPRPGTNYYRLRQTDFNGTYAYSEWISVEFVTADHYVTVFPNPTDGDFTLKLNGYIDRSVTTTVTDAVGRIVSQSTFFVQEGETSMKLSLEDQAAGVYFVTITSGEQQEQLRIVRY